MDFGNFTSHHHLKSRASVYQCLTKLRTLFRRVKDNSGRASLLERLLDTFLISLIKSLRLFFNNIFLPDITTRLLTYVIA
jgi:hypothetical protein